MEDERDDLLHMLEGHVDQRLNARFKRHNADVNVWFREKRRTWKGANEKRT